jgi:prophage antirepressor-like protein
VAPEIQTFTPTIGDIEVSLRCVMRDGEPWFLATDVTRSLGYVSGRKAVADHVGDDQKDTVSFRDGAGGSPRTIISEEGLYSLIGAAKTELAKLFRKWVYGTVLPSIRKHGGYILGQEKPEMTQDELLAKAVLVATSVIAEKDRTIAAPGTLKVHPIEGEPRILDTDLAVKLGFGQPRDIRKLILRHAAELDRHGVRAMVARTSGPRGGKPTKAFYLNEAQALLIVMKAETKNAEAARAEIIAVFKAYRHGQLVPVAQPSLPDFSNPAAAARTPPPGNHTRA